MRKVVVASMVLFGTWVGAKTVQAQGEIFTPGAGSLYTATPLYIGASLIRQTTTDSVKVWNKLNTAGWVGSLWFIDPRTGQPDSLFNNNTAARRCTPSTLPCAAAINLQAPGPHFHDIRAGDTLYFIYKVFQGGNQAMDLLPKYTGPNDDTGRRIGPTYLFTVPTHPNYPSSAHCWSVAGRVNTTTIEFGFEDWASAGSDYDFDDVIFGISGAGLVGEPVATPYANPAGQTFTQPELSVTLSDFTPGASIFYTVDGSAPDSVKTLYSQPISITGSLTLKAIAYKAGMPKSAIMTEIYYRTVPILKTGKPIANPAGTVFSDTLSIGLSDTTSAASICFTTNGVDPDTSCSNSTTYTGSIIISQTMTLKARAIKSGMAPSDIMVETYTKASPKAMTPVATPGGFTFYGPISISLSDATSGATICFTTSGVDPDSTCSNATLYTGLIVITQTTTLKVRAIKGGFVASDVLEENYVLSPTSIGSRVSFFNKNQDLEGEYDLCGRLLPISTEKYLERLRRIRTGRAK